MADGTRFPDDQLVEEGLASRPQGEEGEHGLSTATAPYSQDLNVYQGGFTAATLPPNPSLQQIPLGGGWINAPGPPHVPNMRDISIHSGDFDYISADPDDPAAVLVAMSKLTDFTNYDPTMFTQEAALIQTLLGANTAQLQASGNQMVIDLMEDAGYLGVTQALEEEGSITEVVRWNMENTWTEDQKKMWATLSTNPAVTNLRAGMLGTFTDEDVQTNLSRLKGMYPDLQIQDPDKPGEDMAALDPTKPIAALLNDNFWIDHPELADTGTQITRSGGAILTYNQWLAAGGSPPDTIATQQEYQDFLLRATFDANNKVTNSEDLLFYEWDPADPDGGIKVLSYDEMPSEIGQALDDTMTQRMAAEETVEQILPPEGEGVQSILGTGAAPEEAASETGAILDATQFAQSMYPHTNFGQAQLSALQRTLATYGFNVSTEEIALIGPEGYGAYPLLAGGFQTSLGAPISPNTLPQGVIMDLADSILLNSTADSQTNEDFRRLVEDAKVDENLLPALSLVEQQIASTNPQIQALVASDLETYTNPNNMVGASISYQVKPNYGVNSYSYVPVPDRVGHAGAVTGTVRSPGFNLTLTKAREDEIAAALGGAGTSQWGNSTYRDYLISQAESQGIPWVVAAQALNLETHGFQQVPTDVVGGKQKIDQVIGELAANASRYGNSALAMISTFFGSRDIADTLLATGRIDPSLATSMSIMLDEWGSWMKQLDPGFHDPNLLFAQQALQTTAQLNSRDPFSMSLHDPEAVKEQLRGVYDSMLMPIDEGTLDRFASQFRAAEIAAHQPELNAFNQPLETMQEIWSSMWGKNGSQYLGEWMFPVQGEGVSFRDDFGTGRSGHLHGGNDIMAPSGTMIVAPVAGTISSVGNDGGDGGLRIWLDGVDGNKYYFAHLSSSGNTYSGQRVALGTPIGAVGNTGNAINTAPHLHFEIHTNGQKNSQSNDPWNSGRANPFPILTKAKETGTFIVSPYSEMLDFDKGTFGDSWLGAATQKGPVVTTLPDLQARAMKAARSTKLYKELFQEKPQGVGAAEYAGQFSSATQSTSGVIQAEAARVGMRSNSLEAMWGRLLSDEEAQEESPQLRGRMFGIGDAFTRGMAQRGF